jgi:hypothetical protein
VSSDFDELSRVVFSVMEQKESMSSSVRNFGMIVAALLLASAPALAHLPHARLTAVFPPGGKVGTDQDITATGPDLDEASAMRFSHPGITAKLKTASDTTPVFTITIAKEVPPGIYDARVIGRFGISNPRAFAVADKAEIIAKPAIATAETAQDVTVNSILSGHVDQSASDFFKLTLKANQRVLINCLAREIDSHLEPVMTLSDAAGKELERARRTGLLDFTAPADGAYLLRLHDAVHRGGADFFYRLAISTGPHLDFIMPPSGLPGTRSHFVVYGRNLPGGTSANIKSADGKPLEQLAIQLDISADSISLQKLATSTLINPADSALDGFEYRLAGPDGVSNPLLITYATGPVITEAPAISPTQPQAISAPCEVAGQFFPRGDQDLITFNVKKGDAYWIELISSRLGVPTDPFMVVQSVTKNEKGEQTADAAEIYDVDASIGGADFRTSTRDPIWKLAAANDGIYRVMVRDLFNESSDDPSRIYRLAVRPEKPDFRLIALAAPPPNANKDSKEVPMWSPLLRRGGTTPIKVLAHRRDGFGSEIKVEVRGLPIGVTAAPTKIDAGATATTLLLSAADSAPAFAGPITIVGTAPIAGAEVVREARGGAVVRTVADPANEAIFSRMTRDVVLAVTAAEPEPISIAAAEEKTYQGTTAAKLQIPLKIGRPSEFKAALKLKAVGPAFLAPLKEIDIAAAAVTGTLELDPATLKIPIGTYSLYLQTQTAGKYQRKPEAFAAATAALAAATKSAADLGAEAKKFADAKAPLVAPAAASAAEAKKLADATASLAALIAPAQAAATAATQKQAEAKAASDKEPANAALKAALAEADKALAEANAKLKSATEAKDAVEKFSAAAAAKAKVDADALAAADKLAADAAAKGAEAEKAKVAAAAALKALDPKDVTTTFYSRPILFSIAAPPPPPPATQPTTQPTTAPAAAPKK